VDAPPRMASGLRRLTKKKIPPHRRCTTKREESCVPPPPPPPPPRTPPMPTTCSKIPRGASTRSLLHRRQGCTHSRCQIGYMDHTGCHQLNRVLTAKYRRHVKSANPSRRVEPLSQQTSARDKSSRRRGQWPNSFTSLPIGCISLNSSLPVLFGSPTTAPPSEARDRVLDD
jgi:hypothetical protein